jgi:cell division protein FtsN
VAARRGKNQARRSGQGKRSGLAWLAIGLALGGLAFGYLHFRDRLQEPLGSLLPKPDPNATAKPSSSDDALAEEPQRPKTKFTFFDELPKKEVVITDAEIAAQAQADRAAEQRALENEKRAAQPDAPAGESLNLDGAGPAANAASATPANPAAGSAAPAGAPVAPVAAADGAHYVIQAGAFLGDNEAEALKAKIALTGQVARVEVAQVNGNTVHRVRMGPYPNAASLAEAKAALASHGIVAQAIRVK